MALPELRVHVDGAPFDLPDRWGPLIAERACDRHVVWWPALRWSWPFIDSIDVERRDLAHFLDLGGSVLMAMGRLPEATATRQILMLTDELDVDDTIRDLLASGAQGVIDAALGGAIWSLAAALPPHASDAVDVVGQLMLDADRASQQNPIVTMLTEGAVGGLVALGRGLSRAQTSSALQPSALASRR